jgi:hypothetical protein
MGSGIVCRPAARSKHPAGLAVELAMWILFFFLVLLPILKLVFDWRAVLFVLLATGCVALSIGIFVWGVQLGLELPLWFPAVSGLVLFIVLAAVVGAKLDM